MKVQNEIQTLLWSLNRDGRRVYLHWVKAHVGIIGNERADAAANEGHRNDRSMIFPLELEEQKLLTANFLHCWNEQWKVNTETTNKGKFLGTIRDNVRAKTPVFFRDRRSETNCFRLRIACWSA